jgi:hypothetical protein
VLPAPRADPEKTLKNQRTWKKNRARTICFFLKTVGSLRGLKYPELTGTLILILKKIPGTSQFFDSGFSKYLEPVVLWKIKEPHNTANIPRAYFYMRPKLNFTL